MANAADSAKAQLAQAGRAKDRTRRLTTICIVTALFLLGWALVALLDYWLMLPLAPRWAALAGLCALLAAGVWHLRRLWKQPTALKEAALDVEQARPELGCEVSTAAEYLTGDRRVEKDYEPELVAALQAKAAQTVATNAVPYSRRLTVPALLAGVAVVGVVGFFLAVPGAGTALRRTVSPWSRAQFTQLEVRPGSIEIPIGQPLVISNRFSGRAISSADIEWREEGRSEWQHASLQRATNDLFLHTVGPVQRSFVYRVKGGDATSDEFAISAFVPPAVQRLRVGLTPPRYTQLPAHEQSAPNVTVLRGTQARFEVVPNVALSKARLRFTNDTFVELVAGTNGTWRTDFTVRQDTDYWIELTDLKGRSGKASKHHITALPDAAPKLDIIDPGQDMRAGASDVLPLKIRGTEDFGLQTLRVVYHKLGAPEQELILKPTFGTNQGFYAASALALEGLKLSQYDVVSYYAEAIDNNDVDGPGIGKSPIYFIEITNEGGGPKPKTPSKPKPGEQVNLLAVQKQIINDTAGLGPKASQEKYGELAKRQEDAVAFAKMYQQELMKAGAPVPAQAEMETVLKSMEQATRKLQAQQSSQALPPEETALASLYQVLKNMPAMAKKMDPPPKKEDEDQEMPPPGVKVVLKAIQKKPTEDPNQPELKEMLKSLKSLQKSQADLASQCPNPGDSPGTASTGTASKPSSPKPNPPSNPPGTSPPATAKNEGAKSEVPKPGDSGEKEPEATEPKDSKATVAESKPGETPKPGQPSKAESQAKSDAKGQGKGKAKGEGKGEGQGQGEGEGEGKPGDEPAAEALAKAQAKEPGAPKESRKPGAVAKNSDRKSPPAAQGKPGAKGQPGGQGQPGEPKPGENDPQSEPPPASLAELAPKQEQLSQEAKELADRMQRLAGKGVRAGHGISRQMSQASQQLDRAAHAMRQGNAQAASGAGDQGSASINAAITLLERALADKPELSDVASEEAPKQYEGAISEYFKRLSRAE